MYRFKAKIKGTVQCLKNKLMGNAFIINFGTTFIERNFIFTIQHKLRKYNVVVSLEILFM